MMKSALAALGALSLWVGTVLAQPLERVTADEVKAAFLYNFTAFVEWPQATRAGNEIVIAVMGAPEVAEELQRVARGRKVQDRRLSVIEVSAPEELARAHMVYIGPRENRRRDRLIAAARRFPVLVVTDAPDALDLGSMINFITTDRVQFEVSLEAASAAGLRLSPRLLSVAIRVKKGEGGERPSALARLCLPAAA